MKHCCFFFLLYTIIQFIGSTGQNTNWLNSCNQHGTFSSSTKRCTCFDGYGSANDISNFKSPSCSWRICPAGTSWSSIPTTTTEAHVQAECSDRGTCDRGSGECTCYDGYAGRNCQRLACPQSCSGHGDCLSIRHLANSLPREGGIEPLVPTTFKYESWDMKNSHGCLCHSSWPVGFLSGESQLGEWYGPSCNLKRCPSGNDVYTSIDETDCNKKSNNGASTATLITVSVTSNVASSSTETTLTHATGSRSLVVGDTVTISGHTGNAANTAMNQEYAVKSVTSTTVVVLTGTGMTAGTYNSGTIIAKFSVASYGNKCHSECSNRGVCDSKIGVCTCFAGFTGNACNIRDKKN